MNLTQHFTLEELSHSDYADAHGIKNYPGPQAQQNRQIIRCAMPAGVQEFFLVTFRPPSAVHAGLLYNPLNL